MSKKRVLINYVLDMTGSMDTVKDATISGFNEYLNNLKNDPNADYYITLTVFNSKETRTIAVGQPINHFSHWLTKDNYIPNEMTPLYDAVYRAVAEADDWLRVEGRAGHNYNVLCVIQTDGQENYSRQHDSEDVRKLIEEKRGTGYWEFVFLGANQDAWLQSKVMGIAHAMNYQSTPDGTQSLYASVTSSTRNWTGTGDWHDVDPLPVPDIGDKQ